MRSTFGAWMLDASQLDDGTFWIAEHFSGVEMEAETVVRWRLGPDPGALTYFFPQQVGFWRCNTTRLPLRTKRWTSAGSTRAAATSCTGPPSTFTTEEQTDL